MKKPLVEAFLRQSEGVIDSPCRRLVDGVVPLTRTTVPRQHASDPRKDLYLQGLLLSQQYIKYKYGLHFVKYMLLKLYV